MRSSIDRLTALDQLMLRASKVWPQDIGALVLLDGTTLLEPSGRFRIEAVREAIESRLQLVPRFRQLVDVPRRGLGGPLWVDAESFDLGEHVRVLPLPAGGGEADLLVAVEQLRSRRLDPSRPLWELWFLTGLPERQVALFVKLHHSIADGVAAMATISAFLDAAPDAPAPPARPWTPARPPSAGELLADNLARHLQRLAGALRVLARPRTTVRRLRAAWPAARELLAEAPATKTSLDRMVGPGRNLALIRTTLDQVKQVAHAHGATVNDVLLAATAGGLRALLRSRGEPVEDTTVRIYVPVSLRLRRGVRGLSYAGTFNIGVVADRDAYPDIDVFAAAVRDELHALGVSTDPTSFRPGAGALGARPTRDGRPAVDAGDDHALLAQSRSSYRRGDGDA